MEDIMAQKLSCVIVVLALEGRMMNTFSQAILGRFLSGPESGPDATNGIEVLGSAVSGVESSVLGCVVVPSSDVFWRLVE